MNELMKNISEKLSEAGFMKVHPRDYEKFEVKKTANRRGMRVYHRTGTGEKINPSSMGNDYTLIFLLPTVKTERKCYGQDEEGVTIGRQYKWPDGFNSTGYQGTSCFGNFNKEIRPLNANAREILKEMPYLRE